MGRKDKRISERWKNVLSKRATSINSKNVNESININDSLNENNSSELTETNNSKIINKRKLIDNEVIQKNLNSNEFSTSVKQNIRSILDSALDHSLSIINGDILPDDEIIYDTYHLSALINMNKTSLANNINSRIGLNNQEEILEKNMHSPVSIQNDDFVSYIPDNFQQKFPSKISNSHLFKWNKEMVCKILFIFYCFIFIIFILIIILKIL